MDPLYFATIIFMFIIWIMVMVASSTDNEALRKINKRLKEISEKLDKPKYP